MKFIYLILILIIFSCKNEENKSAENPSPEFITYEEYSGKEPNMPKETEVYVPVPPVVSVKESNGVPSDAITLFDNDNLDEWVSVNDNSKIVDWTINADSSFTIKSITGNIRTIKEFGDIQLHLEWKSPIDNASNVGQEVDSGVFLQGRYEIQILDNTSNTNFTNGFVASVYKQQIPLVKATMPMGKWNTFDIVYHAPEFDKRGHKTKSATITLLHNGVLVQDNAEIKGTTRFIGWPKNEAHGKAPIILQNHKDSRKISFRNIWVRELN
ncbi:DUF1080 domain-containing protein [Cellulophaga baltica]|uniref:3-keto-disaccharide hydrolase n=1 Tax=Cellulophaga TaxID=104264 RepID=UPI001C079297|nr:MULTISPECIES: DUF1080 domain-containing protein [Cellulophaga]MBU2997666.1 DUF1080 domain-containing protein [Cellulophaga baltica]MDO6769061.1 DUF1080 domain-containing protein [Cellulophaga sp. 1_MG-2023]